MNKNSKVGLVVATNPDSKPKTFLIAGGESKAFDVSNYRKNTPFGQCQKCGSDYMKFAVNGFCQGCQQRCEFITREHPHIARQVKNQRRIAEVV